MVVIPSYTPQNAFSGKRRKIKHFYDIPYFPILGGKIPIYLEHKGERIYIYCISQCSILGLYDTRTLLRFLKYRFFENLHIF